jgi:hypothetical protein
VTVLKRPDMSEESGQVCEEREEERGGNGQKISEKFGRCHEKSRQNHDRVDIFITYRYRPGQIRDA